MTKVTFNIGGKETEFTLTPEQVQQIIADNQKITDRVKTFEDACDVLGIDAYNAIPYDNPEGDTEKALNAAAKLFTIAKALNEGWQPDWNNSNEAKYYPWFQFKSGFGFSRTHYLWTHTLTDVGSRLCFKTSELALYAGRQFEAIYKEYLTF